jgi:acyl-coenzyme A thioesterase PaaI-like protein
MREEPGKPIRGSDFIFGDKPGGFGARFFVDESGRIVGKVSLDASKQGPPDHAHGGALIALIDEAMGACAWYHGHRVVAAGLQFNLRRPVPLNLEVSVIAQVDRVDGRKVYTSGTILLPDEAVAVEGTGLFIEAPQYFGFEGFNPFRPTEDRPKPH